MVCPRCAVENSLEQSYCRQCGLALSSVRLAAEGHVDEAMEKMKNARKALLAGIGISAMQILILILGHLIEGIGGKFLIITPFDLIVLGILIVTGIPFMIKGVLEVERANQLLSGGPKTNTSVLDYLKRSPGQLPAAGSVDALEHFPNSVTEQTTIKLEAHKPKG